MAVCKKQLFHLIDKMENVQINEEIESFITEIEKKLAYLEKEESFITVILTAPEDLPDVEGAMREYNTGIIKEYLTEENILYVADAVPAVVLRVTPEDKNALRRIDGIVFIGDAFFLDFYCNPFTCY